MKKSVGVRGAYLLFSKEEEIELQERYSKEDIEILFFGEDSLQVSFDSFIEIILNEEMLRAIIAGLTVEILKVLIFKATSSIKNKKIIKFESADKISPATITIKASTKKGTIYQNIQNDISDKNFYESINKIKEAKILLDSNKKDGINDLFIVENSIGNLEIMTMKEYIEYRKKSEENDQQKHSKNKI